MTQEQQESSSKTSSQNDGLLPHRPDPTLLESFRYISSMPGKDVRGKLIDCFQLWLNISSEQVLKEIKVRCWLFCFLGINLLYLFTLLYFGVAWINLSCLPYPHQEVVADLHNSSLLLDDIEDNSKLRRGIPVAHSIFGVPTVINCANYVFFLALEKCHAWNNSEAIKVSYA